MVESHIVLPVKLLAGTSIETAVCEAKELVGKLKVAYIEFTFNSVKVSVSSVSNIDNVVTEYLSALERSKMEDNKL